MNKENQDYSSIEVSDRSFIDFKVGNRHLLFTACHRIPSRSFHFRGKPLLCYRCLGLNGVFLVLASIQLIGFIAWIFNKSCFFNVGTVLLSVVGNNIATQFIFCILLQIPFILDGSFQAILKRYESTNSLRLITGVLGGTGQYLLLYVLGRFIAVLTHI